MEGMNDRLSAERALAQKSFAMLDTHLFLNTHPDSAEALAYFYKKKAAFEDAKKNFTERFGPVMPGGDNDASSWNWVDEPWPWQEEN